MRSSTNWTCGLHQLGPSASSGRKLDDPYKRPFPHKPKTVSQRTAISASRRKNKPTISLAKLNLPDLPSE